MLVFKRHIVKIILILLFAMYLTPVLYNTYTPFGLCNSLSSSQAISCNMQEGFSIALEPIYFFQTIFSGSVVLQTVGIVWLVTYITLLILVFFATYYVVSFIIRHAKKNTKQKNKK